MRQSHSTDNGDECVSHILLTKVMNASVTFYYNGDECVSHILLTKVMNASVTFY